MINFGAGGSQSNQQTSGVTSAQQGFDPDRAYLQQLMAQRMNGPQGQTGSQVFGTSYGTTNNPYTPDPHTQLSGGGGGTDGGGGTGPGGGGGGGGGGGTANSTVGGPNQSATESGTSGTTTATGPDGTVYEVPQGAPLPPGFTPGGTYTGGGGNTPTPDTTPESSGPTRNVTPAGGPTNPRMPVNPPIPGGTPAGGTNEWTQGGAAGQADLSGRAVFRGYSDQLNNPIPQDVKDQMNQEAANAVRSQYAGAADRVNNNVAASGNTAGQAAAMAQIGRDQASGINAAGRQNNIYFDQEAQRRKENAMSGLGQVYGQTSGNYNTLLGARTGLSATPKSNTQATSGSGNFAGTNFGIGVSI